MPKLQSGSPKISGETATLEIFARRVSSLVHLSISECLRGYLHETGTNSDRYKLVLVRNVCSRLHETRTKCLVDYMRPVRTQKQQILEPYNLHNSII